MKTLKQFMEATGYLKVKSPDEQKFIDKHKTDTIPDANGNGDEVFKASNVKKVPRKAERKGYEPGEDESVYEEAELEEKTLTPAEKKKREEVAKAIERDTPKMPMSKKMAIATATAKKVAEEAEQVNELSRTTLASYAKKAMKDAPEKDRMGTALSGLAAQSASQGDREGASDFGKRAASSYTKAANRRAGMTKAIDKLAKEEFTQSIEALSPRLQEAMVSVHDRLSEENRQKFVAACQTEEGLEKMVAFALENRGV
jgi:hypothetical protein